MLTALEHGLGFVRDRSQAAPGQTCPKKIPHHPALPLCWAFVHSVFHLLEKCKLYLSVVCLWENSQWGSVKFHVEPSLSGCSTTMGVHTHTLPACSSPFCSAILPHKHKCGCRPLVMSTQCSPWSTFDLLMFIIQHEAVLIPPKTHSPRWDNNCSQSIQQLILSSFSLQCKTHKWSVSE